MFEKQNQPQQTPPPYSAAGIRPPAGQTQNTNAGGSIPVGQSPAPAPGGAGQKVYTMPEKFMPTNRPDSGKSGNKKKMFLIIGVVAAILIILIAIVVYAFQVSTATDPEPVTETNINSAFENSNTNTNENTNNSNAALPTLGNDNENTNSGATLNLNVNEDLNSNINEELFPNENTNAANTNAGDVSAVLPDRSRVADSRDKDRDGLTDVEEDLYGTNVTLPDTDSDGFIDGAELEKLFSPAEEEETLLESGAVIEFENKDFDWTIQYPAQWIAESLDDTNKEVLFTADSVQGEFVQVIVSENETGESVAEWFASLYDDIEAEDLDEFTAGGLQGIITPDEFTVYIGDAKTIVGIIYNFGSKEKINFRTTFAMMLASFDYTGKISTSTNDNSNTNANSNANANENTNAANSGNNDNTNANTNTNQNTNANSNTNTDASA